MTMNRRDAGRIGGLQTYLRHGKEHMSGMGEKGGRPRVRTLNELRQQTAPQAQIKIREEKVPSRLSELRKVYRLQQRSEPVI